MKFTISTGGSSYFAVGEACVMIETPTETSVTCNTESKAQVIIIIDGTDGYNYYPVLKMP